MGLGHYILDELRRPKKVELMVWARWMEKRDGRVARTQVGGYTVSTVFLGLDHSFGEAGPPILWESMVFDGERPGCGIHDIEMDRCAGSWEQAEEMHWRMVEQVARALGIPAPRVSH